MRTIYFGNRDCVSDIDIISNNRYYNYAIESSPKDVVSKYVFGTYGLVPLRKLIFFTEFQDKSLHAY